MEEVESVRQKIGAVFVAECSAVTGEGVKVCLGVMPSISTHPPNGFFLQELFDGVLTDLLANNKFGPNAKRKKSSRCLLM